MVTMHINTTAKLSSCFLRWTSTFGVLVDIVICLRFLCFISLYICKCKYFISIKMIMKISNYYLRPWQVVKWESYIQTMMHINQKPILSNSIVTICLIVTNRLIDNLSTCLFLQTHFISIVFTWLVDMKKEGNGTSYS